MGSVAERSKALVLGTLSRGFEKIFRVLKDQKGLGDTGD